uniref:PH domain-containing protein n=1 Tax=Steinernema glaseri TaxID=37863 RepID=A0A1I7YSJ3_9BILA
MRVAAMNGGHIKEGSVKRYHKSLLRNKWKNSHVVLRYDSCLMWYDMRGDSQPAGFVMLKDVVPYIRASKMTEQMPANLPKIPNGYSKDHLMAVGVDHRDDKIHWFLFSSKTELEAWFSEILNTLTNTANASSVHLKPLKVSPPVGYQSSNEYHPPVLYPPEAVPMQLLQPVPQPYAQQLPAYTPTQPQAERHSYSTDMQSQPSSSSGSRSNNDRNGRRKAAGGGLLAGVLTAAISTVFDGIMSSEGDPGVGQSNGGTYVSDNDTIIVTNNYCVLPEPDSEP